MNDLISREEALIKIREAYPSMPIFKKNRNAWTKNYEGYIKAYEIIKNLPIAEPRVGRWRAHGDIRREYIRDVVVSITYDYWFCDCCGYKVYDCGRPMYNYCPNCGAKMGEEINE